MSLIVWLDDPAALNEDLGGKGRSLARLTQTGFPVPAGFSLTADAYRRFAEAQGLDQLVGEVLKQSDLVKPAPARAAAAALTARLASSTLPESLSKAVSEAAVPLADQTGGSLLAAVRSSALSEDGGAASSAGLYESYLYRRSKADVLEAIWRCYCSLWSARAIQYRAFKRLDSAREAMAVVVMQMVPADVAGVLFTANPVTGEHGQLVVNASWGLGEAVVSGRVTPDQYVIDKATERIADRAIGEKTLRIDADPAGSGTIERAVPPSEARSACLTDEQIGELLAVGRRAEEAYGAPVDLEWAFAAGKLFVLQARPITGLN